MLRFQGLKTVRLRGDKSGTASIPYRVYYGDDEDDDGGNDASDDDISANDDGHRGSYMEGTKGKCDGPTVDKQVKKMFSAAGVDYKFDMPQYYANEYLGDWDKGPRA